MAEEPHKSLEEKLKSLDKDRTLSIIMHDHPDPDCISSALVLKKIAAEYGLDSRIYYSHESDFPPNRALMNKMSGEFTKFQSLENPEGEIRDMSYVAFVDVAAPGVVEYYDLLQEKAVIDIDHHPNGNGSKSSESGQFIYKRDSGACVSFLLDWMERLGISLDPKNDRQIIWAAYLGIKVDTSDFFYRSMDVVDTDSRRKLEGILTPEDYSELFEIENQKVPPAWSKKLGEVLQRFPNTTKADLFYSGIGVTDDSAVIPYIADDIFRRRNFDTVIIYGLCYDPKAEGNSYDNLRIMASVRSKDNSFNLEDACVSIFHKKDSEGRKVHKSGGRKNTRVSYGRGCIPLDEESELIIEELPNLYSVWKAKIERRLQNMFKIK